MLLTNKLCAGLNFKHKYIGQISERAETPENVKPSVKLTILDEMVIIEGYHRCSFAVGIDVKFIVEIGGLAHTLTDGGDGRQLGRDFAT